MELCSFLQGITKTQSPIVKSLLKIIKSMFADVIRPCPYHGLISLMNVSVDAKVLNWLPRGTVRFTFKMSNEDDPNIAKLSAIILFEK